MRHKNRVIAAVALTTLAAVALRINYLGRERPLMERSKRIADTWDWLPLRAHDLQRDFTYDWLSDNELLLARKTGLSEIIFFRRVVGTGQEIPLAALSKLFNSVQIDPRDNVVQLSPNRKWILWEGRYHQLHYRFCAPLDGSRLVKWPWTGQTTPNYTAWLSDGKRWVEEVTDGQPVNPKHSKHFEGLYVYDVSDPDLVRRLQCSINGHDGDFLLKTSAYRDILRILEVDLAADQEIAQAGLQAQIVPLNRDPADLFNEISQFDRVSVNQFDQVAHIVLKGTRQSVIISNPDGSGRIDIGGITPGEYDPSYLSELRWLPDGKRLSFICQKVLYVVPAN